MYAHTYSVVACISMLLFTGLLSEWGLQPQRALFSIDFLSYCKSSFLELYGLSCDKVSRLRSETFLLVCITALAVLLVLYWLYNVVFPALAADRHLAHVPRPPGGLPVFGHAFALLEGYPSSKMAAWSLRPGAASVAEGSGSPRANRIVTFNVFNQRVVYINEPALIKRVLLTNQRNYSKDIASSYKHFMCLLGNGLVTAEGQKWRKGRIMLSHSLRIDILEDIPTMTMSAVERMMAKLRAVGTEAPFLDLNEEFRHMTLQVIGQTVLSLRPDETDCIFPTLYLPIVHECNRRVWEPWRTFMFFSEGFRNRRACLKRLDKVICDIIEKRWAERGVSGKGDVMSLCLSQIDKLDKHMLLQLRDDVKTLLLAGHETSAALLTWATYEVLCHPEIKEKIVAEAKTLFDPSHCSKTLETPQGTWGIPSALDVKKKLRWAPAVLRETLRRHSVVPLVMRVALNNDRWSAAETGLDEDIVIPAGCSVAVGIEAVHNRPDIWPDPDAFVPERFLGVDIPNDTNSQPGDHFEKSVDPYAFIPFINGPRNCLGQHLSMMEAQVALAYLLLNWELRLYGTTAGSNGSRVAEQDVQREFGLSHRFLIPIVPANGLKVTGVPRSRS
ncbi:unnamed protein product [Trypanosoma congolense IL3000]|uniref:WGS project CAEQ00000000 data, annotated contig 863 n=1 Tax=Trypanosoma congolense (strain IL3000) TaxID=1068625 RepID=F9WJ25_TRYCI|nr:unnamed protein product [Trypanosoma congolense IL3000]